MWRDQRGREVVENRSRNLELEQSELSRGRGEPNRSPARTAIADAAALFRRIVAPLVVMGVTSHDVRGSNSAMRWSGVHSGVHRDIDRQATVHDARVKLRRLGQTDGEPDGDDAGETAEDSSVTHATNIGG